MARLKLLKILYTLLLLASVNVSASVDAEIDKFISEMVSRHGFETTTLTNLFNEARVSESILEAISRPAEKLPWHKYRSIFMRPDRIQRGVDFWGEHLSTLERAEKIYGVPAAIIVAIIGVETHYGRITGNYRVMDALVTLGFHYPKRADFFRGQLEQYLLLTREQDIDPLSLKGSYAGAMGIPQFIPGSYRHYAADFDNDGKINIWTNPVDAIGSVARYFSLHGWIKDDAVAEPAEFSGDEWKNAVNESLQPDMTLEQLAALGIKPAGNVNTGSMIKLVELEQKEGPELWLGFHNFYVITRYNHSALYAMAVYQLSQEIAKRYNSDAS